VPHPVLLARALGDVTIAHETLSTRTRQGEQQ